MKKSITFTKDELLEGVKLAKEHSALLAKQALLLSKKKENVTTALGLYSYALEEWGKYLILNDNLRNSNFTIDEEIFGKSQKPHKSKFNRGLEDIPNNCKFFKKTLDITKDGSTYIGKTVDGNYKFSSLKKRPIFKNEFLVGDFLIDFETRKNCFYLGWNEQIKEWLTQFPVSQKDLQNRIKNFLEYTKSKT